MGMSPESQDDHVPPQVGGVSEVELDAMASRHLAPLSVGTEFSLDYSYWMPPPSDWVGGRAGVSSGDARVVMVSRRGTAGGDRGSDVSKGRTRAQSHADAREELLPDFAPVRRSRLLDTKEAGNSEDAARWSVPVILSALSVVAGVVFWLATAMLRINQGEGCCLTSWKGDRQMLVGPCVLYRPWPLYTAQRLSMGPRSVTLDQIQAITSDGYRTHFSAFILYSVSSPNELSAGADFPDTMEALSQSAFAQAVGEASLSTLISRQGWVADSVARLLQDDLQRWGVRIHSVELLQIGQVYDSGIRRALSGDAESAVENQVPRRFGATA